METKYSLKPNAKGVYYVHWSHKGRNERVSTRQRSLGTAQAFLATWIQRAQREDVVNPNQVEITANAVPTIAELWPEYLEGPIKEGRSQKGADYCWKFLKDTFSPLTPSDVTQMVVDEYVRARCAGEIGPRKVKPQTVKRELAYIVGCLHWGCSAHRQRFSPGLLNGLILPKDGKPRERWLRDHEIENLLQTARRMRPGKKISRIETYLHIGLFAAAREQAILDLVWSRVDWEMRTIDFDDGLRLEGDKGRAVIVMNNRLFAFMRQLYAERDTRIPDDRNLVMRNKGALWATLQLVVAEAGMAPAEWRAPKKSAKPKATGISLHTLRHTAATRMCRRGVKPITIARFLGNTLQMVLKVYAKFLVDDLNEAAMAMDDEFKVVEVA